MNVLMTSRFPSLKLVQSRSWKYVDTLLFRASRPFGIEVNHTAGDGILHGFAGSDVVDLSYSVAGKNVELSCKIVCLRHIDRDGLGSEFELRHFLIRQKSDDPYVLRKHRCKHSLVESLLITRECLEEIFS